eukprot:COSAG04_NODE_1484_length_6561_cov_1.862272_6_plen_102_part_00
MGSVFTGPDQLWAPVRRRAFLFVRAAAASTRRRDTIRCSQTVTRASLSANAANPLARCQAVRAAQGVAVERRRPGRAAVTAKLGGYRNLCSQRGNRGALQS